MSAGRSTKVAYMNALTTYVSELLAQGADSPPASGTVNAEAEKLYRAFRAAIRAAVPGRQQKTNLEPLMADVLPAIRRALQKKAP